MASSAAGSHCLYAFAVHTYTHRSLHWGHHTCAYSHIRNIFIYLPASVSSFHLLDCLPCTLLLQNLLFLLYVCHQPLLAPLLSPHSCTHALPPQYTLYPTPHSPTPTATKPRHPQHLWTGPISNAPVEIIQGGRSVEVRPVGVTKGLAMQRIVDYMATTLGQQV